MRRAERRRTERRNRIEQKKNTQNMTYQELGAMKEKIRNDISHYNVEALMTCFALAEHRLYGFGHKRMMRSLNYIDELMGDIINDKATMEDYKKELEEETGVIIKCE